jgi:hypothetical protein
MMKEMKSRVWRGLLAAAWVLISSAALLANEYPVLKLSVLGAERKVAVTVEGLVNDARLSITDRDGIVLHTEAVTANSLYRKVLNLRTLPAGTYNMLLETSSQELIQPFEIGAYGVVSRPEEARRIYAPVFLLNGRTLDVSWFTASATQVELKLADVAGYVVYERTFHAAAHKLERRFDLSQLKPGAYSVNLTANGRTWTKSIVVW